MRMVLPVLTNPQRKMIIIKRINHLLVILLAKVFDGKRNFILFFH